MISQISDAPAVSSESENHHRLNVMQLLTAIALVGIPSVVLFPTIAKQTDAVVAAPHAVAEIHQVRTSVEIASSRFRLRLKASDREVLLVARRCSASRSVHWL
jgi:hypothetical protein